MRSGKELVGCWGWCSRLAADDVHDMRSFPNGLLYRRRSSGHWHSNRPYGVHFMGRWKRSARWSLCGQLAADAEHHLWTATGDMCIPHCTPFGRWKRSGCWGWYSRLAADDVHDMRSFPNGLLYCRRSSGHWHSNRPYGVHFKNGRGRQSRGLAPFLIPARRPGENGRPYDQAVRIRRTCEQVDGRFGDCLGSGRYACKNRDVGTWLAW
jgi:acyl-CoA-binding protein